MDTQMTVSVPHHATISPPQEMLHLELECAGRVDSCMMGDTYSHLSIHERARIEMYLVLGTRSSQIAEYLERSPSTISREIHRNGWRRPTILPRPGKKLVAG